MRESRHRVKSKAQGFIPWEHFSSTEERDDPNTSFGARMRIRFGTRGFLFLIAVILAASYFGYRYYYRDQLVLGRLYLKSQVRKNNSSHQMEFKSAEISQLELAVHENGSLLKEQKRTFPLLANTPYELSLQDGVFTFGKAAEPVESRFTTHFFPELKHASGSWIVPREGLPLKRNDRSQIIAYIGFISQDKNRMYSVTIRLNQID